MTEIKRLVVDLARRGFEISKTRGGHLKIVHPAMAGPVFTGSTPSDRRAVANMKTDAQLYRHFDGDGRLLYVGIALTPSLASMGIARAPIGSRISGSSPSNSSQLGKRLLRPNCERSPPRSRHTPSRTDGATMTGKR